jgi:hypothetical protein
MLPKAWEPVSSLLTSIYLLVTKIAPAHLMSQWEQWNLRTHFTRHSLVDMHIWDSPSPNITGVTQLVPPLPYQLVINLDFNPWKLLLKWNISKNIQCKINNSRVSPIKVVGVGVVYSAGCLLSCLHRVLELQLTKFGNIDPQILLTCGEFYPRRYFA